MKSLRLVALSALLTISAICAVMYTSCTKDACKGVTCLNNGTCSGGTCTCPTGYEGTSCETKSVTKFVKNWIATDREKTPKDTTIASYTAIISQGATVTDVIIGPTFSASFFAHNINGTISANTITIPSQTPDNDGYSVSGTGTYDATTKQITWSYSLTNPSNAVNTYSGIWQ